MREAAYYSPIRIVSFVVIVLMIVAILYTTYIAIRYWSGIGV